ncbi:MAG: hypothetical protein LUI39_07840 [Lachnospiraceae bacterium]|nr:hypothetical protein [Lachnospiraceae bacterium]
MAVVGINEEFLSVRREEEKAAQISGNVEITQELAKETENTQENAQETKITQEMQAKSADEQEDDVSQKIKQFMSVDPYISLKEVASMLNVKFDFVRVQGKMHEEKW